MKVYKVVMKYVLCGESFPFVESVRVRDDENIDDVIIALKERLFYDWDSSPVITEIIYQQV
jgi:hypothetical protein